MKTESPGNYPHIGRKECELDAGFWSGLYQSGETGWDQGGPSPGLADFLSSNPPGNPLGNPPASGRVLVPGCGRGHDARAFASAGFEVVAVDFVEMAIREAIRLAHSAGHRSIRFEQADFLKLPARLHGPYDLLFEHTFFCAIDPKDRNRYVKTAARLLRPGGYLLGIFYNIQPETGPPFGSTREELVERFSSCFELRQDHIPRSRENRSGKELLMLWQRRFYLKEAGPWKGK